MQSFRATVATLYDPTVGICPGPYGARANLRASVEGAGELLPGTGLRWRRGTPAFRVQDSGCRVQGAWFRVQGSGLPELSAASAPLPPRRGRVQGAYHTPSTLNPESQTRNLRLFTVTIQPTAYKLHPVPSIPKPIPPNPGLSTLNPGPKTLDPNPSLGGGGAPYVDPHTQAPHPKLQTDDL